MDRKMNVSDFRSVSVNFGRSARVTGIMNTGAANVSAAKDSHKRFKKGGRSKNRFPMLALLSVCTACFCFAFIFELTGSDFGNEAAASARSILNAEKENNEGREDEPGKLQLVELPSILQVFASSNRPIAPVQTDNGVFDEESCIAKIYASAGTEVSSILEGTVKSVSPGSERGGLVIVSCSDDIDIFYYGLSRINVERGQPILQGSTIGILGSDTLYLKITKRGRPVDPFEFLGIKAGIG